MCLEAEVHPFSLRSPFPTLFPFFLSRLLQHNFAGTCCCGLMLWSAEADGDISSCFIFAGYLEVKFFRPVHRTEKPRINGVDRRLLRSSGPTPAQEGSARGVYSAQEYTSSLQDPQLPKKFVVGWQGGKVVPGINKWATTNSPSVAHRAWACSQPWSCFTAPWVATSRNKDHLTAFWPLQQLHSRQ